MIKPIRTNLVADSLVAVLLGLMVAACGGGAREPSVEQGQAIFQQECSSCHTTTRVKGIGPGLRNLLKREINFTLPNRMPPTEEGLWAYLLKGTGDHPVYADMSEVDMDDLIAFLKTL